jgi:hypothetical protein
MSLRYAHLAPDQRQEAVAKLIEEPILGSACAYRGAGFRWTAPELKVVETSLRYAVMVSQDCDLEWDRTSERKLPS